MSATKRIRIFAGPNGSGKSTFVYKVQNNPPIKGFSLGVFVNADEIEAEMRANDFLYLGKYKLNSNTKEIQSYFKKSKFAPVKLNLPDLWKSFEVMDDILLWKTDTPLNSYIAADLAEFIRQKLMKSNVSFSYETVMSDKNKIEFLKKAKKNGYRIYLYYFATEDPIININRVEVRVEQNGHEVKSDIVRKRYFNSLNNLKPAIKISDRAYLFDNSGEFSILFCEITEGVNGTIIDQQNIPQWFYRYVYLK